MREERQADTSFTVYSVHRFHHAEVSYGVGTMQSPLNTRLLGHALMNGFKDA